MPASFRGAYFHVDMGVRAGGKRLVPHEFPKKNDGYTEEMGRQLKRFTVNGYVVGPNFIFERDMLVMALEADGPGWLILPTGFNGCVQCDVFNVIERREQGGMAEIEMTFVEAGQPPAMTGSADTQAQTEAQANAASDASASSVDADLSAQSGDAQTRSMG